MTQREQAEHFARLHVKGEPLILVNIWDAGSAKVVAQGGAKALATGSWSVAAAHGFEDGEQLPLELMLANLGRIVASVNLPVSADIEGGYGRDPDEVAETVKRVIEVGAVGINLEDQVIGGEGRYSVAEQCRRLRAARGVADEAGIPLFINARADVYLQTDPEEHSDAHLDEAVERLRAYAEAGANGFFAPGLRDPEVIRALCEQFPLPVNIMLTDDTPTPKELATLGVARVSYGPLPYRRVMGMLMDITEGAEARG